MRIKGKVGSLYLILVFGVIVLGYLMVGGFVSKFTLTPSDNSVEYEIISPTQQTEKTSLQLDSLKFRECSGVATIDLLLDRTGSMGDSTPTNQTKISRLKEAVLQLVNNLSDTSVIGIQSFDSTSRTNDIPVSYYKDVKNLIPDKVNALQPGEQTPTHDALAFSYDILQKAKPLFKNRIFNFIFISDGQPVPDSQDPRLFNPNPADQIKALGINVFTLAIYDSSQANDPKLASLLKSIASKPENYYQAQDADQVANLLQQIFTKICE